MVNGHVMSQAQLRKSPEVESKADGFSEARSHIRSAIRRAESAGVSVDQSATVTGTHDDAEYRCVPMSAQGIEAAACVWREDHSVGMTLDTSPDGDITSAVIAAYDATHA